MAKRIMSAQRTLQKLKSQGLTCAVAEKWNPHVGPHGIRQDLFGFIDIIAICTDPPEGIIAVQSCTTQFAEHKAKILGNSNAVLWLQAGGRIQLWGWRKLKEGGRLRWQPRVEEITLESFM
jgi:hypothetical protein